MTRFHPVPFYFTVPGTTINGQVSKSLSGGKRLVEILMIFPAGTSLNLLYQIFLLAQPPKSLTALPTQGELTTPEILPGVYVGDAVAYSIPYQYEITDSAPYLAMFATNNIANQLSAQAIAILEEA